jgi:hypothetical protein
LALATGLVMGAAQARPAVVRVFEAKVHADANANARVVAVLVEGQRVSVSERPELGWFRIRLADGTTAWVNADALFLPEPLPAGTAPPVVAGSAGATPGSAAGTAPVAVGVPTANLVGIDPTYGAANLANGGTPLVASPNLGIDPAFAARPEGDTANGAAMPLAAGAVNPVLDPSRIGSNIPARYIDDLDLLNDAVGLDPAFTTEVADLHADATVARWFFWGGLGAAALMAVVPFTVYTVRDETMPLGYAYGAGGILLVSSVVNLMYEPGTEEMERIARKWNEMHPEQPLSVGEPPR